MLKVGVVGLGAMGQHHARLYSYISSAGLSSSSASEGSRGGAPLLSIKLVGVADANPERAQEIGEKYQVKYYSDYHELLGKVEAVSIAVASSLKEAAEMIKAAERHHVNLAVGHIERFNPAVVKLKEIIDKGTLGKLLILSTRRVGPSVPRIRDVGVVIDSATHDIGVVKYLVGKEPVSVFSRVGSLKHPKEDHAVIVLDFAGTTACIEVNWFTPHKVRTLVATGSEGIAYLDYIEQTVEVYNTHADTISSNKVTIQKAEPLKLEIEDFLKSILEGTQPAVDGAEGLAILKIALDSSRNNFCVSAT
jgi:UDP-N-acetylglucosamine 3-dehydrogenase